MCTEMIQTVRIHHFSPVYALTCPLSNLFPFSNKSVESVDLKVGTRFIKRKKDNELQTGSLSERVCWSFTNIMIYNTVTDALRTVGTLSFVA